MTRGHPVSYWPPSPAPPSCSRPSRSLELGAELAAGARRSNRCHGTKWNATDEARAVDLALAVRVLKALAAFDPDAPLADIRRTIDELTEALELLRLTVHE
jgi:hypothetical protein